MNDNSTSNAKRDRFGMTPEDRARRDAMTDDEITAAALTDPDNPPLTDEQLAQFQPAALVRKIRHKLHMGRDSFAAAYGIPVETLRAWERHELQPNPVETAYLRLIEREPERAKLTPAAE